MSRLEAASIIPVCSSNNSLTNCKKSDISFPLYEIDTNGQALFSYKVDQGDLGELSSAEIVATTEDVLELWSNESNIVFEKNGTGLTDEDITENNFSTFLDQELGYNLIIWDEDGDIISELFGNFAKFGVLGYATPIKYKRKNGLVTAIEESQSLLNGFLFDRVNLGFDTKEEVDSLFQTTILHEFAHMFGIDHTQGGNLEDYNNEVGDFTDIPVMFPFAANPNIELHQDDVSAIKLAYPKTEEENNFATISGSLVSGDNDIKGANVVAYKVDETNPKLFAVASPSDVDGLEKGNYHLPKLLPGSYVLFAEPIDSEFEGGSSIGFHEDPADFEAGFYNGANSFLKIPFSEGIARAELINLEQGENLNIDINIESSNCFKSNDENLGFRAGGRAINCKNLRLAANKNRKAKLKLVNLNPGTAVNLAFSTNFPDLISFSKDSLNFSKRSKKVKVKLASRSQFIENGNFADLENSTPVAVPVTITNLDSNASLMRTLLIK